MSGLPLAGSFSLSRHASTRMAQRGIQAEILDMLLLHGEPSKTVGGCERYCLLDRTAKQLRAVGVDDEVLAATTKLCAIVSADGTVVTCYHGAAQTRRQARQRARHRLQVSIRGH